MKCYLCGNKFMPALNFNELLNPLSESLDILCSDCQNSFSYLESILSKSRSTKNM